MPFPWNASRPDDLSQDGFAMARPSWFQKLTLRYFSKPASDRGVLLYVAEHPVASILEIGVGEGKRTMQMLAWNQLPPGSTQLRYVGVDPFESSEETRPHLKLKQAHRMLSEAGVKTLLVPGDATTALPRVAHSAQPFDLVVIDGGYDRDSQAGQALLHWLPRLVAEHGVVFASSKAGGTLQVVSVERPTIQLRKAA